ncbi:conserved hypothetical protein [Ricinus communis]|uniref:Pectinesterase inhibitor domain-containing protein n=2 Tax=Ricinus communis TaxID=3988 RepID=B9SE93_RICCO|nr:conserved hypothetical protein [Ricinus communis]
MEATFKNPGELISDICKQSGSDKKFCIQILKSNPQTATASSLKSLAEIALGMARKESVSTSGFFKSLLVRDSNNPAAKASIEECAKYFSEAVGMLNLGGLEGGTASLDVHYALDNAQYCENALANANVHIGSIGPAIQEWKKSYSVAYAAVIAVENSQN